MSENIVDYLLELLEKKGSDIQYRCGVNVAGRDARAHNQCPGGGERGRALGGSGL